MQVASVMFEIRTEAPEDADAIYALTAAAFAPMAFSDGTEAALTRALRIDGDLTLSLVAVNGAEIVGHVAFSPVTIDGILDGWFGLGPVSVRPALQRRGIGTALIRQGLETLKSKNAKGCALIGNPDYYHRFGFQSDGGLTYGDLPVRLVQWVAFGDSPARGALAFAPAFGDG